MSIFFLVITTLLFSPGARYIDVAAPEKTDPWQNLINAIGKVECNYDTTAVNQKEQAYGFFQVRQVRLDDYRKRTGIHYSLADMLDYSKAKRVFMFYAWQYGPYDYEGIAKRWNGSGPMTEIYWQKVKRYL